MKSLCITGASSPGIEQVAQQLFRAGLAPAKGLQRGASLDMKSWHERFIPLINQQQPLGRLWEQMAGELLLTNMADRPWGWHDINSLWALEFWAELDPGINFLLLCRSPEQFLAGQMLSGESAIDPQACLSEWQALHERMLNFYFQHPERCLLVDADQAAEMPEALCAVVNERWQLLGKCTGQRAAATPEPGPSAPMQLASYIAKQWLIKAGDQVEDLVQELQAAQYPLVPVEATDHADAFDGPNDQQVAALLQQYQEATRQAEEYGAVSQQLQEAREQAQHSSQQLQAMERELQDQKRRSVLEITSLAEEKAQLAEQLLMSLHQTQEQLEQSQAQRATDQRAFAAERESLTGQREEAGREACRLAQAERELTAARSEGEELAQRLQVAQEQLIARQESETQRRQAEQETERLQQESEKLLLVLHRTQENLEREVQQHQGQQAQSEALKERLYRLKQRGGAGMAADSVAISHPQADQVQWVFEHVLVGDREYSLLTAAGKLKRGRLILKVTTESDESWSLDADHPGSLTALTVEQRELASALPALLQVHLQPAFDSTRRIRKWQRSIDKFQQKLAELPPLLTFAAPELHHVQINPDYEHLWIRLPQASFAGNELQQWQFRVSCANVTPQAFGTQPKLEIPRQQTQLLEEWFQESQDSFGEKLELRFALPSAMDGGVWKRLRPHDQRLLQSLMTSLPEILSSLEQQGHHIGRDWQDWHRLAADMRRILQARAV